MCSMHQMHHKNFKSLPKLPTNCDPLSVSYLKEIPALDIISIIPLATALAVSGTASSQRDLNMYIC